MHLPGPLRAAVGLVASAADEVKGLPDRAVELPMLAVSTALQVSLRAQHRYAQLAARGERVLNRQAPGEEPPAWATFDDPLSVKDLQRAALSQLDSLIDGGLTDDETAGPLDEQRAESQRAGRMLQNLFGVDDPAANVPAANVPAAGVPAADVSSADRDGTVVPISQAQGGARKSARKSPRKSPAKKIAAKKVAAKKVAAKQAPAKRAPVKAAKKAPATKAAAKKTADAGEPAEKTTDKPSDKPSDKTVNKPRHTAPSKFDDAADD